MRSRLLAISVAAALITSMNALAQAPRLTIVVPFAAGGGIDIFARLLGEAIGKSGEVNVVIEDRPGASSMIGTEFVARAKADGATALISSNSTLITPMVRKSDFDPLRDLTTVCVLAESPQVIVVKANAPYQTLADLIAAARHSPGALTIGSNGPASTQQLVAESFKRAAAIDMTYVPYNGGAPAMNAVIGGQITAVAANMSETHSQIVGGAIRALATTAASRISALPDLPTAREQGLAFDMASWHGVSLPANAPTEVSNKIRRHFMDALASPELRVKLSANQYTPTGICDAAANEFMRNQVKTIEKLVHDAGIKID